MWGFKIDDPLDGFGSPTQQLGAIIHTTEQSIGDQIFYI